MNPRCLASGPLSLWGCGGLGFRVGLGGVVLGSRRLVQGWFRFRVWLVLVYDVCLGLVWGGGLGARSPGPEKGPKPSARDFAVHL